jgi:hypothetical protein
MTPGLDDDVDALARLRQAGDAIVAGVDGALPSFLEAGARRVLDAWDRLDPAARRAADAELHAAAVAATARVVAELRTLFAVDAAEQRSTPLQIVRSAVGEPTAVLAAHGVPQVVRDQFAERSWPDDVYGLAPHTLDDLGVEDLGPLHLAWGMAKARVLRARRDALPES